MIKRDALLHQLQTDVLYFVRVSVFASDISNFTVR